MAKLDCDFFPGTSARWNCPDCQTYYGERCIPEGDSHHWGRKGPLCVRCEASLNDLGLATDAKPFWQRLPHFLAYPFQSQSLLLIALVTLLPMIIQSGLLGLLVSLFCLATVIKYGLAIITTRGEGVTAAPAISSILQGDEHHLFLRQIGLFVLMGLAVLIASGISSLFGLLILAFMAFALPASVVVLAVDKSIRRAINPFNLLHFMLTIGWPYLLLWFCSQAVAAGPYVIADLFMTPQGSVETASEEPSFIAIVLLNSISNYFTLVLYAMLGYVLYEYQSELGFVSKARQESDLDEQQFLRAKALGSTAVLISDQQHEKARKVLRQALEDVRDDIELHLQYHKLLMLLNDDQALVNHGQYLVDLMFEQQAPAKATSIVLDVQSRHPTFKLESTRRALVVAQHLVRQGHFRNAIRLFHNHHKYSPNDPLLPAVYLLTAKVFSENLNDDEKACAIARYILKVKPQCSERQQFESLLEFISST
ncbi:DUF4013 domain-containing protein [Gilvimarinus sp. SDUM040013]|uniref:DUF4013 domain-containing protein n=1 Tax=Gilvimarinus gilvus TaxID=3058038 RepID=A0ABU4RT78_9GAMM|nr:DUF4013 domain-containing protein [Gilvimarinus sp. SDUM040013]MDO3387009.1 DUF4013 domain-containing protein [Gilvimarinus sp. SDUM040013]MDX6848097.1 DUF4013 domain-containing protein [Gilvimarinus sp. SDUM040013]